MGNAGDKTEAKYVMMISVSDCVFVFMFDGRNEIIILFVSLSVLSLSLSLTPCGLRGCKNGPAPFPGRMSYKATKLGLVFVLYLSMFFIVLVFIRAPFMYC